jgi:ribosomal protein S18 acetylase RimI-like enzyme
MKHEIINETRMREMERNLGCVFCKDGECAEMSLDVGGYTEKTAPIPGITFGRFDGDVETIRAIVRQVEPDWAKYFSEDSFIFCAYANGEPISFCLVDELADGCMLARPGIKVGSIGCVGTVPQYRRRGIGLDMTAQSVRILKDRGCDRVQLLYLVFDKWYGKLGFKITSTQWMGSKKLG